MKVPDVRRNLVPDTWTADGEGTLPELGPCPHDNSCVGCRRTDIATSIFISVDIVDVCWPTLIKNGVHHSGDLKQSIQYSKAVSEANQVLRMIKRNFSDRSKYDVRHTLTPCQNDAGQ